MNPNEFCPFFKVVPVCETTKQLWFNTNECSPSLSALAEVDRELNQQSAGAFSLRLDQGDLRRGLIEIRRSAVFPEDIVDLSFEEVIEMVEELLCKTASRHPTFGPNLCDSDHI